MYLPDLIRQTESPHVPLWGIGRQQCMSWIAALSDLLIAADSEAHHQVADATISDAAYLLYELTGIVQAFDECDQRARETTRDLQHSKAGGVP